jgi:RNA polymerase sigma factor (sigma-70 family)
VREQLSVETLERIYRTRGQDFFRYSLAATGEPDLAREAVQEGFARAIRSRRSFRGEGSAEAWVARCVLNAARDLIRRRTAQANGDWREPASESGGDDPSLDYAVRGAVRQLPPRQREALFLRFYLDLDYAAIAEALDIEVGTVSATLHSARKQLGRILEEAKT